MAEGLALIIEDSFTQAQIIGRMLTDEDWRYLHTKTVDEGLQMLIRHHPSLVFVDVFLGEDNGLQCLPQVRDLAPEATIAVMTAGSEGESIDETLKAARHADADFVLRKPFSRTQVRAIVQTAEADMAQGKRRPHALVVDDSQTIVTLTSQMLSDQGFRVSTAKSMEEALSDIDIGHIDLAVCDIFMPGMGGLEGIKLIKSSWPQVRVLAMSAGLETRVSPERATSAAVRAGADAEIQKPFKQVAFINMVIGILAA